MPVFDIRGTHGSGKSTVVHTLLKSHDNLPILENGIHLGYHIPELDLAVLGKYQTACGGCDGIKTADEVVRRVRLFAGEYKNVVLEGILVSHTFDRYNRLAMELSDYGYIFCFLDTPLEVCINRVRSRRVKSGNTKELNPSNVIKDWHRIWERLRLQCLQSGLTMEVLDWHNPVSELLEIMTCQG